MLTKKMSERTPEYSTWTTRSHANLHQSNLLTLVSWLAYRTHKMPRLLPFVGFLAALAGVGSYVMIPK